MIKCSHSACGWQSEPPHDLHNIDACPECHGKLLIEWFTMDYDCERCEASWSEEWVCPCEDRCPDCNTSTEPREYTSTLIDVCCARGLM